MTQLNIRSELAATVFKIEAREGDVITTEHPILVLESMKMEIPVLPPQPGTLLKIHVNVGDLVREGQDLATLDTL